jgi:phosphatidylglycerol---prolipoprotein diacylglyceryl transferase
MHPTLFNLGPIPIRSYGLMMMIGFLVAIHLAARRARQCGADEEATVNLGLLSLVTGIIGARIFYVVHHWWQFAGSDRPLFSMINLTAGGLEFYGGFITAVAAVIVYTWVTKRSIRWYLDILAPAIMIGLAFGRVGCLLNGCCWGAPTKLPVAIQFPYGSLAYEFQWSRTHEVKVPAELILETSNGTPFLIGREYLDMSDAEFKKALAKNPPGSASGYVLGLLNGHLQAYHTSLADLRKTVDHLHLKTVPIHPTQIYEIIAALLIAWVAGIYFRRRSRDGMVIALVFVLYPIARFLIELLRADNPHDTFGLTISQGISVASIPAALLVMLLLRKLPARSRWAVDEFNRLARQHAAPAPQKKKEP